MHIRTWTVSYPTKSALAAGLFFVLGTAGVARCTPQFAQFRSDAQRSGRVAYSVAASPTIAWTYAIGIASSATAVIDEHGTTYFGANDRQFYSVESNGAQQWSTCDTRAFISATAAIADDGTVYFANQGGNLYAMNSDSSCKWALSASMGGAGISGAPLLGRDGTIYIGDGLGWVRAVSADGNTLWSIRTGGAVSRSLASSPDGSVIYAPSNDGRLYAIGSDGSLKWRSDVINPGNNCAIAEDGTVYVGSTSGVFYAFNPDGSVKWTRVQMGAITTAPAIGSDGSIYFGGYDGYLRALDSFGNQKWSYRSSSTVYSSPTLDASGTILFGTSEGKLVALEANTGSLSWTRALGNAIHTSPTIGSDGSIYVMASGGNLVKLSGATVAQSPEPGAMLCLISGLVGMIAVVQKRRR